MIKFPFIILISGLAGAVEIEGFKYSQRQIDGIENSLASYAELAERASIMPDKDLIPSLGMGLRKTGMTSIYVVGDRVGVHKQLQQALLAIPGHAEYYRDDINASRQRLEAAKAKGDENGIGSYQVELSNKIMFGLRTLEHLPSVETVRVLGEFLYDERGYVEMPPNPTVNDLAAAGADSPVFRSAARVLGELPLSGKPVMGNTIFVKREDVQPWRNWYEEIKVGKRTFRFEGDPTEYDLNGPASKEKVVRIERDRKRELEREEGFRKSTPALAEASRNPPDHDRSFKAYGILAGCILVLIAASYFLKKSGRVG